MTSGRNPTENEYGADILYALLRHFDWHMISPGHSAVQVWLNRLVSVEEILIPADPTAGDYEQLLRRAFKTLKYVHGSEAETLGTVFALQNGSSLDATRWVMESTVGAGLIPWEEGEKLFSVARASLAAAAKASKEARRYYGNAATYIARKFLDGTYMGQTEIGSFVVTAYTPAGERFYFSKAGEEASLSQLVSPQCRSGAEILDKFEEIITGVRDKLDEFKLRPRDEIFEELVPAGLSYEMSNALAALTDSGDGAVKVSRQGLGVDSHVAREYVFESVESSILKRVANRLSETREPERVNLLGEVTLLDHISTLDAHTVRLHVSNRPDIRTVRIRLNAEQYQKAIDAHRDDKPLRVSGTVEKEGRFFWLYDPSDVATIQECDTVGDDGNEPGVDEKINDAQERLF